MAVENFLNRAEKKSIQNLFIHLIIQRELERPVVKLAATLNDLRKLIRRLIEDKFFIASKSKDALFIKEIFTILEETKSEFDDELDHNFLDYCMDRIISTFIEASKLKSVIKKENIKENRKLLPVLEPFDLDLKPFIRLIYANPKSNLRKSPSSGFSTED